MLGKTFGEAIARSGGEWQQLIINYVTYLFVFETLHISTVTTYLAGLQHRLAISDVPRSVWSQALHQTIRGFTRDEVSLFPHRRHIKIPFTRSMIKTAYEQILLKINEAQSIITLSNHAALCMGLMFLFRKSEYLNQPRWAEQSMSIVDQQHVYTSKHTTHHKRFQVKYQYCQDMMGGMQRYTTSLI